MAKNVIFNNTENKVPGQLLPSELVYNKIQNGGGRHIENHIFDHNSAIIERICIKFETGWKWLPADRFTVKIRIIQKPTWRWPPFWNQLNGNKSTIFEQICTKFDADIENKVPGQHLPPELVSNKIQHGSSRHIENYIFGHNSAITAHICSEFDSYTENKAPESHFNICHLHMQKSKMAEAAILKSVNRR